MKGFGERQGRLLMFLAAATAFTLGHQACSRAQFNQNSTPSSSLAPRPGDGKDPGLPSASGGTTTDNPKPVVDAQLSGFDDANIHDISVCLDELKLEPASGKATPFNVFRPWSHGSQTVRIRFNNAAVSLDASGTRLGAMTVPAGQYSSAVLSLSDNCAGRSLAFTNSFGKIEVKDSLRIELNVPFQVNPGDLSLSLDIKATVKALEGAKDPGDVEDLLDNCD